ncbi:hypothetical protein GEMRC1_008783 [Eukaryota sp. GEM-RC1]
MSTVVQQSLLTLILLHLVRRFCKSSLELKHIEQRRLTRIIKQDLPTFFVKVAYVSDGLFETALLSTKVFLQTNTFHVFSEDFPQLFSFASFFEADVKSVFLHVDRAFNVEEFLNYSGIISGLELEIENHNDLEFLQNSSLIFPRLKQLHVGVNSSVSMAFLKVFNEIPTVTSVYMKPSIGDEGIRALAEALKVNDTVTTVNLWHNSIGAEGARVLADMLKVNNSVSSIHLGGTSIGDEGVKALVEALKVNTVVTSIDLWDNSIGDEGACSIADALKINTTVTSVDLKFNSIGDDGAKALADVLEIQRKVKILGITEIENSVSTL